MIFNVNSWAGGTSEKTVESFADTIQKGFDLFLELSKDGKIESTSSASLGIMYQFGYREGTDEPMFTVYHKHFTPSKGFEDLEHFHHEVQRKMNVMIADRYPHFADMVYGSEYGMGLIQHEDGRYGLCIVSNRAIHNTDFKLMAVLTLIILKCAKSAKAH